jgi:hypothetical protein
LTQPINSGAPTPVQGVTGGPAVLGGQISSDPSTGNVVINPNPGNAVEVKKAVSAFNVYEYFNSNTDNVRIGLQTATGGPEFIGVQAAPTSVTRDLAVGTTGNLSLGSGNTNRWTIFGTSGHLVANVDGVYDIGQSGLNRPRNIYALNAIVGGFLQLTSQGIAGNILGGTGVPAAGLGSNGDFYFNVSGAAALTAIYQKRAGVWVGIV